MPVTTVTLGPDDVVRDRPFTSVEKYPGDLVVLNAMLDDLRMILTEEAAGTRVVVPHKRIAWKLEGLTHRALICNPERLRGSQEVCAVGFFSERHTGLDVAPLEEANLEVVREFKKYPGVLSYSSVELPGGLWANLVLHDTPEVVERWRESKRHARAVAELSPVHYRNVRIHNAKLTQGVFGDAALQIERTKYFDYDSPEEWRAIRELTVPRAV
jgi:hypothetical protein